MKKIILILTICLIISCNNSVENNGVTDEYKLKFEQQIEAFKLSPLDFIMRILIY